MGHVRDGNVLGRMVPEAAAAGPKRTCRNTLGQRRVCTAGGSRPPFPRCQSEQTCATESAPRNCPRRVSQVDLGDPGVETRRIRVKDIVFGV